MSKCNRMFIKIWDSGWELCKCFWSLLCLQCFSLWIISDWKLHLCSKSILFFVIHSHHNDVLYIHCHPFEHRLLEHIFHCVEIWESLREITLIIENAKSCHFESLILGNFWSTWHLLKWDLKENLNFCTKCFHVKFGC